MQKQTLPLDSILAGLKIKQLNEMQLASLEANEKHKNVVLLSDTGSGKTLAFLLPVLAQLDPENKSTQALIIAPTRELALQIEHVFKAMQTGFKVTCCYGGHLRETEENNLKQAPALIIGTSGRLADHIRRGNITVETIETLVLDEFDKSLELGFQEELKFIISSLPNIKKRILTSATEAEEIPGFIGLRNPEKLNFLSGEKKSARLEIKAVYAPERDKLETLFNVICLLGTRSSIVFCTQRETVEQTSDYLVKRGIAAGFYHGAMEQKQRDIALCKYRNGSTTILVTTDLASRGLDIPNIRYIIHYDLPPTEEIFTHRNGRTARMVASGTAILLLAPNEYVPKFIDEKAIEKLKLPDKPIVPEKPKWTTLYVGAGKKDKINKIDIVGFLSAKGELKKEDIGLIEVKDFGAYVAVRKSKVGHTLQLIKDERLKGKKIKIEVAK